MVLHVPPFYGLNASQKNDNKDDINNRLNVSFIGVDVFTFGGRVQSGGSYQPNAQALADPEDDSFYGRIHAYRESDLGGV